MTTAQMLKEYHKVLMDILTHFEDKMDVEDCRYCQGKISYLSDMLPKDGIGRLH